MGFPIGDGSPPAPISGALPVELVSPNMGSPESGGNFGTDIVSEDIPGDLGTLYLDKNKFLLLRESLRENASYSGVPDVNIRYRGHRESNKFNLVIQRLVTVCAYFYLELRSCNVVLTTRELDDMYPTDTEVSCIYHVQSQISFKEWMLLKDDNKRWYT